MEYSDSKVTFDLTDTNSSDFGLISLPVGAQFYLSHSEQECLQRYQNMSNITGVYCSAAWDSLHCWPPTPAGQAVSSPCSVIFATATLNFGGSEEGGASAYRECGLEGSWLWGTWPNYTECLDLLSEPQPKAPTTQVAVSYILFICSFISLLMLAATLFIFCYFKSLQCSRLRVHRNLVGALIIHSLLLMLIPTPVLFKSSWLSYRENEWTCKLIICLKMYAAMASINWMFVEGLLLHSRITVSVFQQDAPFKLYYFLGWGIPLIFVSLWVLAMYLGVNAPCWEGYGKSSYLWIVTGPMIAALVVNAVFLVNIIRILVTKLRRSVSVETKQIRQAAKATALLFPLLGITHLMFCVNPRDDARLEEAYMITNAVLQSSQGFCVAILYCFMNSEVQTVLRNTYLRAVIRWNPNHRVSRIRSVPRNSTVFYSHTEVSIAETTRHKMSPYRKSLVPLKFVRTPAPEGCTPNGKSNDFGHPCGFQRIGDSGV